MKEKSVLLFETKELTAQKYFDFLKDTPWEVYHKQNLETFLETLQNDTFDLIIAEESMMPEEVLSLLAELNIPVILSTNSVNNKKLAAISRDFSSSDLINAIGKASFLKIVRLKNGVSYEEPKQDDEDEPVLLEPVFEENSLDAVVLTPEKSDVKTKSSWEIPERKEPEHGHVVEKEAQQEKTIFSTQPFQKEDISKPLDKEDKNADFLFDDDYKYDEKSTEVEKKQAVQKPAFDNNMANDFEAILNDKPLNIPNTKAAEFEIETHEDKIRAPEPPEKEQIVEKQPEKPAPDGKEEIVKWLEKNGRQIIKEIVLEQLSKLSGKDG